MRVRYRAGALADLRSIEAFLLNRSPTGAISVMCAIRAAIAHVAEFPRGGAPTSDLHLRVKIVRRYGYKIFYSVDDDAIEIVHVRHPARRPWR
jgi:plasmid stabilization system protein ParE